MHQQLFSAEDVRIQEDCSGQRQVTQFLESSLNLDLVHATILCLGDGLGAKLQIARILNQTGQAE